MTCVCPCFSLMFLITSQQTDYIRTEVSPLKFNESGNQNILIDIVDDPVIEANESFSVVLHNPLPDTVILNPDRVTIIIIDNDEREFFYKDLLLM